MSFPHEVIAAWPTPGEGDPDRGLIRAMTTRRFAYTLAPNELASDFVAKDPVSGIPPLNLIQNGTLYAYDETDSTTAASAVCLVTNDACRYKSGVIEPPYSVLTYSTTAQPADVDVSDGDTFLLPIGATGADWAGKAGQIAIRVGAKWHFAINPIGRRLYVQDADRFYYRNASGVWVTGNGTLAFAAASIPITAVIGAKASFVVKVENQTTNAPPASPLAPVAYVIGSSPTGAWAGKAGQLAVCLTDGVFTIIVPEEGDEVWDKTRKTLFRFNGTGWVSAAGAFIDTATVAYTSNADLSAAIPLDDTIPQISEGSQIITTTFTPKGATNKLRVRFEGTAAHNTANGYAIAALFLNSNANAIAADFKGATPANSGLSFLIVHEFVPGVTSSITLSIRVGPATSGGGVIRFNGATSGRLLGGVMAARLVIEEIPA